MRLPIATVAGAGAVMLAFAFPATAAPAVGTDLKSAANENSTVDQVHYRKRRCWRHHGHLHCRYRRYVSYYDGGYYGYGLGPSIGLYFGGGGRHFHHGGRHHRR